MRNQLSKEWLTIYDQLNSEGKLEAPIIMMIYLMLKSLFNKSYIDYQWVILHLQQDISLHVIPL